MPQKYIDGTWDGPVTERLKQEKMMETDQAAEDALAGSRKNPYEETNDIMDELSERLQEEEDTEVSFRIGTEELTNEGKVSLALEFASVGDMLKFRDSLDEGLNIRQIDSLDRTPADRQFILRNTVEESVRVARYVTTEG